MKQLQALQIKERKHADKQTCKELAAIVLNQPAKPPKRTPPPLTTLMSRLKRLEARIKAINILCDEYLHKYGGEPSTVALIKQHAQGDYDR